jgi:2-oxoglutarate ferredoxin oxidoreductase subunit alpha
MSQPVYTVKIAGPAGAGIKSSGLLFSQMLLAHGFNLRDYSEYPSLVRGGHNTYQVSFSTDEILAPHFNVDLFFSLLPNHWQQHESEFSEGTLVFGDDTKNTLPLKDLAASAGGAIYTNTICLGVATYILNLDLEACKDIISKQFGAESPNNQAFLSGYDYASQNFSNLKLLSSAPALQSTNHLLYDGNESFGWGFIKAGGSFYSAYPMTPASGALHFLAGKQAEYGFQVLHPEDEIAAASLSAGATFAGARAATGTSGGGFALMTETVSFCGAAELGTLFYLVSRPGPATGLPTWTGQGDLLFAVNAGHGEFNKIVIAPGNQAESFEMAGTALNLGAQFNIPIILVSDKFIAESGASQSDLSKKDVDIVKSTKSLPGTPGQEYMANSYEHDEHGFSVEDSEPIKKSVEKRQSQLQEILNVVPKPTFYGQDTAKKLIVSWGSPSSTILETLRLLNNPDYAFLQIKTLWPIDKNIKLLIAPFTEVIVIENSATSQLTSLLKSQFDFNPTKTILKYDGRPFFPEELIKQL